MEAGRIYTVGTRATWIPVDKRTPYALPFTLESALKRGYIPLSAPAFVRSQITAYVCRSCGKGVFDIPPLDEVVEWC